MVAADGTWDIKIKGDMGTQGGALTFRTSGDALEGSISGAFGAVDFSDGTIAGDELTWVVQVEQPLPLTLEWNATVSGDAISGDVILGTFGKASFSGARGADAPARERAPIERLWDEFRELGLESYVAELDTLGYTVVPPTMAAPDGLARRLLDAVLDVAERRTGTRPDIVDESLATASERAAHSFPLGETMPFLLTEDEVFEELLMNPVTLAFATYMCGRSVVLSAMFSSIKGPNPTALPLHADDRLPAPLTPHALVCNATFALTEYSREGGCLAVVPGSHRLCRPPQGSESLLGPGGNRDAIPVECEAGSLIMWHGNTWHGAYPRTLPGLRASVVQYYSRPQLRTQDDLRGQISQAMLDRHPPRFAVLTQQGIADMWTDADNMVSTRTRASKVMAEAGLSAGEFTPTLDG